MRMAVDDDAALAVGTRGSVVGHAEADHGAAPHVAALAEERKRLVVAQTELDLRRADPLVGLDLLRNHPESVTKAEPPNPQGRLARVPHLTVVGSINLDLVAKTERLPRPGETVTDATFSQVPGGKGANQAVAAARLGAQVCLVAKIGNDDFGRAALAELQRAGVDLTRVKQSSQPTGVALITIDANGENEIVVAPGANSDLRPEDIDLPDCDGVLCQLEIPLETVEQVADTAPDNFFLNAAPARDGRLPAADLTVVNRYEYEVLAHKEGLIAVTHGAEGAILLDGEQEVARATPPKIDAVDGTGAGDAFTACLVVSLLEGRDREEALRRACAAGAIAASRPGAQPSLPTADEVDGMLRQGIA